MQSPISQRYMVFFFLSITTPIGTPKLSASLVIMRLEQNSVNEFFIIEIDVTVLILFTKLMLSFSEGLWANSYALKARNSFFSSFAKYLLAT